MLSILNYIYLSLTLLFYSYTIIIQGVQNENNLFVDI